MEYWNLWVEFLSNGINFISLQFGLTEAVSIIVLTLLLRLTLFPLSYKMAYSTYKNKQAMEKLKPEITLLKEKYKEQPNLIMQKTMSLYKKNNIKIFPKGAIYNLVLQGTFGLGACQAIRSMHLNSKFLWIANIAKPDVLLALLVGALTFLSMAVMPGATEQNMLLLYLIPVVISVVVLISFPSGLGLYWATSNIVTIMQQLLLKFSISRQEQG